MLRDYSEESSQKLFLIIETLVSLIENNSDLNTSENLFALNIFLKGQNLRYVDNNKTFRLREDGATSFEDWLGLRERTSRLGITAK